MSAGMSTVSRSGVLLCPVMEPPTILPRRGSCPSRNHEFRCLPQQIGGLAERLEMLRGLPRQVIGLGARALLAEDRHEGGLARRLVLARRLAKLLGGALDVQKVVDDLEGEPEIVRIG